MADSKATRQGEGRDAFRAALRKAFQRQFPEAVRELDVASFRPDTMNEALQRAGAAMLPDLEAAAAALRTVLIGEVPSQLANPWSPAVNRLEQFVVATVGYRSLALPVGRPVSRAVLEHLHGRAIVTAWEVAALIRSSLPSGASARWRSLHELAVAGVAIAQFGEEVAERYVAHEAVRSWRVLKELRDQGSHWKVIPIPEQVFDQAEAEYHSAIAKFGRNFRLDYEWARPAMPDAGARIQFADIERKVGGAPWRMKYAMASEHVHAGDSGGSLADDHGWENPYSLPRWTTSTHGIAGGEAAMSIASVTNALVKGSLSPDDERSAATSDFLLAALEAMRRKVDTEFESVEMEIFRRTHPTRPS